MATGTQREKERQRERERSKPSRDSNLDCGLALRRCSRTVPHCAASFLELLTTVESVVFQRGSAWLCMGLASVPVFYSKRCHVIEFLMPACLATIKMPVITVNAPRTALNACSQLWLLNQNTAQTQLQWQLLLLLLLLTLPSCSCLLLPPLSYSLLLLLL